MTTNQVYLVQQSFTGIDSLSVNRIGSLFYSRLFYIAPELKPLFCRTSLTDQAQQLVEMLMYGVKRLDRPDSLVDILVQLARRHRQYGVEELQYMQFRMQEAMLWSLKRVLGYRWSVRMEEAWVACYTCLVELMLAETMAYC
ncbi:globin domain-containing protein [Spirosoma gilvum]